MSEPIVPSPMTGPLTWESKPPHEPLHPGINMPWTERTDAHTFPTPGVEIRTVGRQFGKSAAKPDEVTHEPWCTGSAQHAGACEAPQDHLLTCTHPTGHGGTCEEVIERLRTRLRRAMGAEPRPMVIGLGGYAEHGKDALADILVERHGFMKFGMSDSIHDCLMVLDPLIPQVTWADRHMRYSEHVNAVGYTQAKRHPEVRRLLRILGTEVGRDMIDPDIWTTLAAKKIRAALDDGKSVVITGIRNGGNEIGLIAMHGGTTVWVDRPGHPIPETTHRSENTLGPDDFTLTVTNDGSLADLAHEADLVVSQILASRARMGR